MINAHYRALTDIHMPTNCSVSSLRILCGEMEKHFRSVEALAQDITWPVFVSTIFCEQNHWSDECKEYPTMDTRQERIRGRCFIFLAKNHLIRECD